MRWKVILGSLFIFQACSHTMPGTDVQIIDKAGSLTYVAGAAAPGMSQSIACASAVNRAVGAIALKFSQENEEIAEEVAKAVGVEDGKVFLSRYAKATSESAAVPDVRFDPAEHLCLATVRWNPPIFVKDAVLKYAETLKAEANAEPPKTSSPPAQPVQIVQKPAPSSGANATPPPPPVSVAPPAPVATSAPANSTRCSAERKGLKTTLAASQRVLNDFEECKKRTSGDEKICHRYKLYVEEAQGKEHAAGEKLAACLNVNLSTTLRGALKSELPGHAAVSVENRNDGTLILWTFSPVDQTSFALEISPDGKTSGKTALAANQVQWVREQLGF